MNSEKQNGVGLYADTISVASSTDIESRRVIQRADSDKDAQMRKMIIVIILPILALVALTIVVIVTAANVKSDTEDAQNSINNFLNIDKLVTALQVERGIIASYLSSGLETTRTRVTELRLVTDNAIEVVQDWPSGDWFMKEDLSSKQKFTQYLTDFRNTINSNDKPSISDEIHFYTDINDALINAADAGLMLPEKGDLWSMVVAVGTLLRASDAVGIQRALGSTFYNLCEYSDEDFIWFSNLEGQAESLMGASFSYSRSSKKTYDEEYVGSSLHTQLEAGKDDMANPDYKATCEALSDDEKGENSAEWFQLVTDYMGILIGIRSTLTDELNSELDDIVSSVQNELMIYIIVLCIVVVLCILVALWYANKISTMISEVIDLARMSKQKSRELSSEKKKTEMLLHQMLPKSVVDQLKAGREVKPEYFDEVTICYLDIVGFVAMISKCTPLQVVNLLNSLYGMFDDEVEKHVVYKMEQSNDVYGIVSGLPDPNKHHAAEIANLLIALLKKIERFRVPNMPDIRIQVRVGAHSGTCAAGIVGTKTPRYSIFGESVKMASRMSRNGEVMKIQISEDMKVKLDRYPGNFNVTKRGEIEVYGKGMVTTYFLQGHGGSTPAPDNDQVHAHF